MPYVAGESLRGRLARDKQLPVDDALRLTKEVASALDYAHRQGVVHRDIKPENILLQDGAALVADFGIALAVQQAGGSRMTQTGMSLGTPAYMSPEQAMGEREIGARSDVYALGAMAYEMLAGEPPFTGPNSQAIVAKVLTEQPLPLRTKRPLVSPAAESAILTALQKLPADRFGSAKEFAEALTGGGLAGGRVGGWAPTEPMPSALAPVPQRRRAVVPILVALSALSALSALYFAFRPRTPPAPAARYQVNLPGLQRNNLRYSGSSFALSRDGRRLAYVRTSRIGERSMWVLEQPEGEPRQVSGTDGIDALFFSPDGNSVAFFSAGKLFRVPFTGGKPVPLADSMSLDLASGVWRDDGTLLVNGAPYDLRVVPEDGGAATVVAQPAMAGVEGLVYPTILPDRNRILAVTVCTANCGRMTVSILDVSTRKFTELIPGAARASVPTTEPPALRDAGRLGHARGLRRRDRDHPGHAAPGISWCTPQPVHRGPDGRERRRARDTVLRRRQRGQPAAGARRAGGPDRTGRAGGLHMGRCLQLRVALARPSRLAIMITDQRQDLWVKQLDQGPITRLTFEGAVNYRPFWLPGGRDLLFLSDQSRRTLPYSVRADGSGKPVPFPMRSRTRRRLTRSNRHRVARGLSIGAAQSTVPAGSPCSGPVWTRSRPRSAPAVSTSTHLRSHPMGGGWPM